MTHEPIEGLDEALKANPKTPAQWGLIGEAAIRYRDLCKPVDVEAIRYEITDILEGMGVQNLHAVMGGHKITLHLAATGRLNTPATSDAASCSGTNASLNQQAGPADAQGGGANTYEVTPEMAREAHKEFTLYAEYDRGDRSVGLQEGWDVALSPRAYDTIRQLLKERAGV